MRLNKRRKTVVKRIELPEDQEALKFVREGVQAFPELYFSRFVILGQGDSEEVVLPRLLAAKGILVDDESISAVPLGGRHVNHFWRLLHGLGIPHVTLLDLDLARYHGGWGRIPDRDKVGSDSILLWMVAACISRTSPSKNLFYANCKCRF
ncbi:MULTISPECIES: ATP-dependent endonuclease [unclassified Bradyrhizobium]|uniref:ATP-dependent endonuclease n=1 Tax=unclassified Bradyrhizobium TaxID=2631580 RepID=UPI00247A1401|nr:MULTISPECIES: ATP-dependent endonuclease [unclassified Bradyrhizobium]WGR70334.1 ATP-dependent endonuclease [Bradyrhizobium sp. ISRA426]WGR82393.1 ATP-dependent endonuclease [Bradyrhizobium sp. ISRA430]WGR85579.1 ATP-dependent endonuclease [Bradyrhizobium sp. ISRA432]